MITKFMTNPLHTFANASLAGGTTMQNKTNLNPHNEVIIANEPWHRGSGFTWMLLVLAGAVFFFSGVVAKAGSGFFGDGTGAAIFYSTDGITAGEGIYKNVGGLNGFYYGEFVVSSGSLILHGGEVKTYKNGGSNVTGANEFYRIYKNGATAGSFTSVGLPWSADLGGGDQRWKKTDADVSLLNGLTSSGTYVVDYYFTASTSDGTHFMSNSGNNYRTTFDLYYQIDSSGNVNQSASGGALALDGNGKFVKKNTGTVTLNNANSGYTGNFFIDGGTIAIAEGAAAGTGSFNVGLDGASSTATISISDANGGTSVSNQINIRAGGGNRTITSANTSGSNTFSGNVFLDSDVNLSSSAGGNLILSGKLDDGLGAGNYSVNITAGSVEFAGSTSNVNLTSYTVKSGAQLRMNKSGADAVQSSITIDSGGIATLVAGNQLGSGATVNNSGTLATGGNSDTFGTLNSSGSITGTGTLTAGTYNITGGTVSANLGSGILNANGNSTINGNTTAGTLNVTGDTTLNGTSSATTVAVSGSGTDLNLGSGGNRLSASADVTVAANSRLNISFNQTLASVKEAGTSNGGQVDIGSGAKLTITGANKGDLFQNTISGSGDLEMAGSGTTTLALYGTQSYTGSTTVSGGKISTGVALGTAGVTVSGGTFETTAANILGNGASVNISAGIYSLGGDDTVGSLTISGGSLSGSSTLTAATYALQGGTVGANLGLGAATASSGTTALNGNLSGSLEATGGTVNTAGTIGGNVTVSGGTVNLSSADRIANGSAISVSSGTLGMGANNDTVSSFSISGGTLGGTGKLTAATYGLSGGTVNANLGAGIVNANSGTTALNGTADATTINVGGGTLNLGSGGRLATGATANVTSGTFSTGGNETITRLNATGGTVNLTGDNLTVTGTGANASSIGSSATATGGTISVQGSLDYQATTGTTALSVASGGTLSGSGTTTGTLSVSGKLAPGNSTGIMNVGSTTFLGGGSYAWEIDTFGPGAVVGTNWDFLNIAGSLTISATSGSKFLIDIISLLSTNDTAGPAAGFNLASNYSFAIATASGGISGFDAAVFAISTSGFQNSMGAGNPLYTSAGSWSVSQQGNSLMLNYAGATAIPEPSVASMFVLGLSALLANRRRRA